MQIKDIFHCTFTEAAAALSVHRTTIRRWIDKGAPVNSDNKTVSLPQLIAWRLDEADLMSEATNESEAGQQALMWFREERARVMQITRERLQGRLKPVEKITKEWAARVSLVAASLESLRFRLPPVLEGKTRVEMAEIIQTEVRMIRDGYYRDGRFTPADPLLKVLKPCLDQLDNLNDGDGPEPDLKN